MLCRNTSSLQPRFHLRSARQLSSDRTNHIPLFWSRDLIRQSLEKSLIDIVFVSRKVAGNLNSEVLVSEDAFLMPSEGWDKTTLILENVKNVSGVQSLAYHVKVVKPYSEVDTSYFNYVKTREDKTERILTVNFTSAGINTTCTPASLSPGEYYSAGNSWWGCAARFSKSWPISDQKMSFSTPIFRPDL